MRSIGFGVRSGTAIAALSIIAATGLGGCTTVGTSVKGASISAPATVRAPQFVNPEIAPYAAEIYAVLSKRGFTVAGTDDPAAMRLDISFDPNPFSTSVKIALVEPNSTVVASAESTNHAFGTIVARPQAIGNVVQSAANQFDMRLAKIHFEIAKDTNSSQKCMETLAVDPGLDVIRQKVEFVKSTADAPPPFDLAANDTFPNDAERAAIARWAKLRDDCLLPYYAASVTPAGASAIGAVYTQQDAAFGREATGRISALIVSLYQAKLTYGEFAQKRYEISRDAIAAERQFRAAVLVSDREHQMQAQQLAQQDFQNKLAAWSIYVSSVNARQPKTVHVDGSVRVTASCTTQSFGGLAATNCQ